MQNKIFKITFIILTTIFILLLSTNTVCAMSPVHGYRYSRGVSDTCYFIDSTASAYSSYIRNAAYNWEVTGHGANPIYVKQVTSSWATHADIYGTGTFGPNTIANTTRFTNSDIVINPKLQDWFYAEIRIKTSAYNNLSEFNRQGAMTHEFGHCFGLTENNNDTTSIMCQLGSGRTVNKVAKEDNDAINYLY